MHHIRRQTFEIKFSSQQQAFNLQTRFTELMHDTLLPVMEEVFTQVSLPNVIIRLDVLTIDLGEVSLNSLEQDLPDILRNKLTDALLAAIGEIKYFPKENNQLVAKEKADIELLVHFLQSGNLPWWSSHARDNNFSLSTLLEQCLAAQPGLLITYFQQELKAPEVRLRLTRQFPDELLFKILSVVVPARQQFIKTFLSGLFQLPQTVKLLEGTPTSLREMGWEVTWTFVFLQKHTSFEDTAFAAEVFTHISRQQDLPMPQLLLAIASSPEFQQNMTAEQGSVQKLAGRILAEQRLRRLEEFTHYFQQRTDLRFAETQNESERFSTLIQAAAPVQAATIENLAKQLAQIFEQAAAGTSVSTQIIQREIRESVINYLFVEKHSAFDIITYLKSHLPQLITKLQLSLEQVYVSLANAGSEAKAIVPAFRQVLEENPQLFISHAEKQRGNLPENNNTYVRSLLEGRITPPIRYSDPDILKFFLQYGVIPWTERIRNAPDLIEQLMQEMIENQPDQLRQWLHSSGLIKQPGAVQRIQANFSPEIAAWFFEATSTTELPQPSLLSMEALSAQPDVLVHYLWAYLNTGKLPAEVPFTIPDLLHTLISFYPTSSREFISTLSETQQQILLDASPELVTFLATEPRATTAGIPNLESATNTKTKGEAELPNFPEEKNSTSINTPAEDTSTYYKQPAKQSDELIPSPVIPASHPEKITTFDEIADRINAEESSEISTGNLPPTNTSDASEQSFELPADLPDIISSKPIQTEIDKSEALSERSTDKKMDSINKVMEENKSTVQDVTMKEKHSINIPGDSNQPDLKNKKLGTNKQNPEGTQSDTDQQHTLPEEQNIHHSKIDVTHKPEDSSEKATPSAESPAAATNKEQTILPDKQAEQDKESIPGKSILKKTQDSGKKYIWRQPQEPLYIRNAGLILIHPFLTRFFAMLKLTANKKFIDEQAAQRGVHLLHYISHKSEGAPEYELALNKVLCGLPVSMPLETGVELTEEEKETCESLINGVIHNWTILKNTSPDNFRVSFLHREGRLVYTSEDWQLKVENRGYDILIDKLPWAYSIIKLPWMERVLRVEWR